MCSSDLMLHMLDVRAKEADLDNIELIQGTRKTLADAEQDFNTCVNTHGTNSAEARQFMRAVMMQLLDIEAEVARIRTRPTPTRTEDVVVDEMGIQTKCRELDVALGDVLSEAMKPNEELRRIRASNRVLEQASALLSEAAGVA